MSFDAFPVRPERVAVIGGGISGMAAAYLLSPLHHVTLYEAAPRLGGHARTVMAGLRGDQPVDTGFIVFNYANYPHLTRMFRDLDVPVTRSDMSFGVSVDGGRIEYGLKDLGALAGQRRNLARPSFLRMVRDILRFNTRAEELCGSDSRMTVSDMLDALRLGHWFRRYYLLPICGAIWSSPPDQIARFPAGSLVRFFRNHALLSARGQHPWWTVRGGSIEYVRRLEAHLLACGCEIRPGSAVSAVRREASGVTISVPGAVPERFDQVVFACHSDQALRMIENPTPDEQHALGRLRYQANRAVLHRDSAAMPRRRACWASWVYTADRAGAEDAIGVTYWMNRLQGIPETDPLFVSLNPARPIADEAIYDETVFHHPVFDGEALMAQREIGEIQGRNRTWFAGAYLRHGFHEDGFASAVRVARAMNRQAEPA